MNDPQASFPKASSLSRVAELISFASVMSLKMEILGLWYTIIEDEKSVEEPRGLVSGASGRRGIFSPRLSEQQPDPAGFCWLVGMTKDFRKAIREIDRKLQGRILEAIDDISENPVQPNGDTVKPLSGDMKDFWRYRIGDYRLVYLPDREKHQITLWTFAARGGVYD